MLALARYIASQPKLIDFAEEGFADGDLKVNVESPEEDSQELENDEYQIDDLYQLDNAADNHGENVIDLYAYCNPCSAYEGAFALCK